MTSGKSALACRWSIEEMAKQSKDGFLYLWTLTTPDECDDRECRDRFSVFWNLFRKQFPEAVLIHVLERHPGGHGWHIHFVCKERFWVNSVRKYANMSGFGRIHVLRLPAKKAGYVAKYLDKAQRLSRGIRIWGVCGKRALKEGFVKVRDIVVESNLSVFKAIVRKRYPGLYSRETCAKWVDAVAQWALDEGYFLGHWKPHDIPFEQQRPWLVDAFWAGELV